MSDSELTTSEEIRSVFKDSALTAQFRDDLTEMVKNLIVNCPMIMRFIAAVDKIEQCVDTKISIEDALKNKGMVPAFENYRQLIIARDTIKATREELMEKIPEIDAFDLVKTINYLADTSSSKSNDCDVLAILPIGYFLNVERHGEQLASVLTCIEHKTLPLKAKAELQQVFMMD